MSQLNAKYDLEERCYDFACSVRGLIKKINRTIANVEDGKQLVRSSGSVGANYIEANESLGKKDFLMHIKISKKEAKESMYWLRLLEIDSDELEKVRAELCKESQELMKIFGAILARSK